MHTAATVSSWNERVVEVWPCCQTTRGVDLTWWTDVVQASETVCTDDRVLDKIRERVPDRGAGNWKGPATISIEPVTCYCKTLTVAGTQLSPSVSIGGRDTVVGQVQWSSAVQTPVNCHCQTEEHPIWDVKPMKLVVAILEALTPFYSLWYATANNYCSFTLTENRCFLIRMCNYSC